MSKEDEPGGEGGSLDGPQLLQTCRLVCRASSSSRHDGLFYLYRSPSSSRPSTLTLLLGRDTACRAIHRPVHQRDFHCGYSPSSSLARLAERDTKNITHSQECPLRLFAHRHTVMSDAIGGCCRRGAWSLRSLRRRTGHPFVAEPYARYRPSDIVGARVNANHISGHGSAGSTVPGTT